jgi:hypothetical protein
MREAVLLVAVLAVLGGGVWYFTGTPVLGGRSIAAEVLPPPAPVKPEPKTNKKARAGNLRLEAGHKLALSDEAPLNPEVSVVTVAMDAPLNSQSAAPDPVVDRPLPEVGDLKPGMGRDELSGRFGEPTLRAYTVDRGAGLETYIYQRKRGGPAVIAYLRDGKLERARASN